MIRCRTGYHELRQVEQRAAFLAGLSEVAEAQAGHVPFQGFSRSSLRIPQHRPFRPTRAPSRSSGLRRQSSAISPSPEKLALHHQRDEHLLAHQTEAGLLHRARVGDELSRAPRAAGRCARSGDWLAVACGASSRSRRNRASEKPTGQGPSPPVSGGRSRLQLHPSTGARTNPLACLWQPKSAARQPGSLPA